MQRTQIYLRPEQHRALLEEAGRQGISLAELIRRIVEKHLAQRNITKEVSRETYLRIVGIGTSGKTDVSERHDDYLTEALDDEHNG
ncbi:MAG TPA: CopG family transcriptional regulator [Syntrophomonadaceae bacterium]|nr:CopG family transcriptional regulator [Syntrophomonadaceae bacterium]